MQSLLQNDQELPLIMSYDDAVIMNRQTKVDVPKPAKVETKPTTNFWGTQTKAAPSSTRPATKEASPFVL